MSPTRFRCFAKTASSRAFVYRSTAAARSFRPTVCKPATTPDEIRVAKNRLRGASRGDVTRRGVDTHDRVTGSVRSPRRIVAVKSIVAAKFGLIVGLPATPIVRRRGGRVSLGGEAAGRLFAVRLRVIKSFVVRGGCRRIEVGLRPFDPVCFALLFATIQIIATLFAELADVVANLTGIELDPGVLAVMFDGEPAGQRSTDQQHADDENVSHPSIRSCLPTARRVFRTPFELIGRLGSRVQKRQSVSDRIVRIDTATEKRNFTSPNS